MSEQAAVGAANKGDCIVRAVVSDKLEVKVQTSSEDLFGTGLKVVVEETLSALGSPKVRVDVEEHGALDYVIRARVEAALRRVLPELAVWRKEIERGRTGRDRLRRTRLYAPGNNPRLLAGIELHGADCVLLDLEDSVPLAEKSSARILVKHLLSDVDFPEVWVRINPLSTYGRDDLAEVMLARPHGICLPKAESADDVKELSEELARLEHENGIDPGSTFIMPIIETGKGVLHAEEIASADERVVIMAFGAEDYTRDVGARRTRDALLYARSRIVAACAAAGIQASDTVYADVDDEEGLIDETKHIRDLGFVGKGAINPRQIEPIHGVFRPTDEEVEQARKIISVAREAEEKGIGAVAIGGKMIDRPVLERAKRTVDLADRLQEGWL
ncbi:HpcH/HpaI aldolase/citrate lyase family protein [Candidatus Bipolaricaulota bacterium]|nr:HpcH/HpaI aldolase/citrate lyase family protein [Candidatus Bipolaricaulota bacterium]